MTKVKELEQKIEKMISQLKKYQETKKYTSQDIEKIQKELHEIDQQYNDGAIKEADGTISAGQAEFSDYLNECHDMIADLLADLPDDDDL